MTKLTVRADFGAAYALLAGLSRAAENQVISAALYRTAQKARTEMTRQIAREYALPAAEVRGALRIYRGAAGRPLVILDPFASRRGRSMNVIRFLEKSVSFAEARRRARAGTLTQLRFRIRRDSGLQTIPGAFVGNRGRTVFRRLGKARLPIEAVSTIGVPAMFNTRRIHAAVLARIRADLPVEIRRALAAKLAGRLGRRG